MSARTRDMAVMRAPVAIGFGCANVAQRLLNTLAPAGKPLRFVPLTGERRPMTPGIPMARSRIARCCTRHR